MVGRIRPVSFGAALLLWSTLPVLWTATGLVAQSTAGAGAASSLFVTADRCMACHNGLTTSSGEDISIGFDWRASMMANSARDPYWQAAVRREVLDHPAAGAEIQDECSKCHMPMMRYGAHVAGEHGRVFANLPALATARHGAPPADETGVADAIPLAQDGVSCSVCHQILADNLGTEESLVGGFLVDTATARDPRDVFGPFSVDPGRTTIMHSASGFQPVQSGHIQSSELCATCHTLITHALGPDGQVIGELPEQVPFQEWQHSAYRDERSCQSCHMPVVESDAPIASVLGQERSQVSRHVFRGGNFFILRMLNRYRSELGVQALPQELDAAASRTVEHLRSRSATLSVEATRGDDGALTADVTVQNLAGHKLPTAYPSRRAWLHVAVRDADGSVVFESGALSPDGSIRGNDNDADPARYEPHFETIERPEDVQIYEAILAGPDDAVTTGLLTAVRYAKDNRLLPRGFEKRTAGDWIAVHGAASADDDFRAEGDRIRYVVDPTRPNGPFTVEVTLWYQPIGFRWAQNLRTQPAFETDRFVSYYESMADVSATVLATARTTVP